MILGGDFNYSHLWPKCHELFQETMGVSSVITANEATITRTHAQGNVLDHVLVSDGLVVDSVKATPMPPHITDHYLLSVDLTLKGGPQGNPGPTPDRPSNLARPPPPPDRFPIAKLKKHVRNFRTVQIHVDRAEENPLYKIPASVQALKAKVDPIEKKLTEGINKLKEKEST